ncbi:cell surface glycoprotein 1-like [Melanotaenia boesemani]|uniref:cell surface glycoprotein 1-like n=1 Tax=Melanotaenia boesemani TaxID=1250792 RepID=UPI001C03BFB6|nr:cell surface glycoprotein 1-like [Melanotaenia boesemani]
MKSDQTNTPSDKKPKSSLKIPKMNPTPGPGQEPESERSETATLQPNETPLTETVNEFDENYTHEPKSDPDSTHGQKMKSDQINTPPDQRSESSKKSPKIYQKPKPGQELESERSETSTSKPNQNQNPVTVSVNKSDKNPLHKSKSNQDSVRGQTPEPDRDKTPSDQRPKLSWNIPKINQKPKPGQAFKPNRKPKPPPRYRPQTRPTVKPGPKPAVQPKLSQITKTHSDPPQISWTASNSIQNSQTDMPPTSGLIKQIAEVTHSPRETEFSASMRKSITLGPKTSNRLETGPNPHRLTEDFTLSPNSRIMSDLRPQTTGQPSSIQMTTRPNKINRGILQSVITSTSPGSTHSSLVAKSETRMQANILHNVEETRPATSVPSPSSQTTSTLSPDFGSTTPVTSGPKTPAAELSTPSTRELRVKINQVAAFLNNSLSPNGRTADRFLKEQPKGTLGGNRPDKTDLKLPTSEPSKVRRDCSDHLLRGETKSGVYLVTPDLRSRGFAVFCDMKRDGGGWTLLQRRQDGSVSFNRTWAEYQSGFGELDREFWLGNNMIHLLTRDRDMVLRVELEDFDGVKEYAQYAQFRVAGERLRYRLTVGGYSGTAGDALRFNKMYDHNNRAFTTPDKDHDRYPSGNCGAYYSSGWWFDACMAANLNGRYYFGKYKGVRDGIFWGTWHNISKEYYPTNDRQSFKTVRMMIRPKDFAP